MSTCKGAWKLQEVRDQVLAGKWVQYDTNLDPGTLWTWGYNSYGPVGDGTRIHRSSPVQLPGNWCNKMSLEKVSFGIKTDGTLWAWGNNQFATLGLNDTAHRSSPVQVPGTQWSQIFGGTRTTLAIKCVP